MFGKQKKIEENLKAKEEYNKVVGSEAPIQVETMTSQTQIQPSKKIEVDNFSIQVVATQTAPVIVNNKTQESIDEITAITMILNKLDKIEKTICG